MTSTACAPFTRVRMRLGGRVQRWRLRSAVWVAAAEGEEGGVHVEVQMGVDPFLRHGVGGASKHVTSRQALVCPLCLFMCGAHTCCPGMKAASGAHPCA